MMGGRTYHVPDLRLGGSHLHGYSLSLLASPTVKVTLEDRPYSGGEMHCEAFNLILFENFFPT